MLISPRMDLGELAQRMGQDATHEDAEYLRDVLCETNPDEDTADIPSNVWQRALRTALALQLADELEQRMGKPVEELIDENGNPIVYDYQIAFAKTDGSFDVVRQFQSSSDDEANEYAEQEFPGTEWYVLRDGRNINAR